ncbi:Aldehyde/histidinol dehydrogenase [Catenaria anguillulae PL171]|uniref:glutamate-5-semialdehyde dehydrogenase n=1 Tax=Catenaria anguillulae PL171 TaxID=765915 RepID=A0A1Y2H7R1_9FUNG|nr:Aldehyde/histidinol dehydrogenase [Catenaria anguillulae PL171]
MQTMTEPTADQLHAMAKAARAAGLHLQATTTDQRNAVLATLGTNLRASLDSIRAANQLDLDAAKLAVERGDLSSATFKRLDVLGPDGGNLDALVQGVQDVVGLDDPLNQITLARELDTNLNLYRVTCPIGVLLIIFEARPEVVIQISSLAIKSGNAVILKGGKEATHTLRALHLLVQSALTQHNLPAECVQLIEGRAAVGGLLALEKYIDLVIPRGSASLVRYIKDHTRIPVMGHADGICAVYLDKDVPTDFDVAQVIVDAKTQYPAACNAAETLLVHQDVVQSDTFKHVVGELIKAGVQLKCDPQTLAVASAVASTLGTSGPHPVASSAHDYDTEFLDLTLAVKSIASLPLAMEHIRDHGSGHTDVIL